MTNRAVLERCCTTRIGGDNPTAPWMVLIHGAGGSIRTWKFQIEAFAPHYRLLLLDLRDHGLSKDILPEFPAYDFDIVAEDILRVVDHLGIQKAHFVSLSIGSVILQKIDIERPELIDRMVMAGAIFDGSWLMHLFVHSAKVLNFILPVPCDLLALFVHRVATPEPPIEPLDFPSSKSEADTRGIPQVGGAVQALLQAWFANTCNGRS